MFVGEIKSRFGLEVSDEEVSFEAVQLYHEEIDENYISSEELEKLLNLLMFETLMYVDDEDSDFKCHPNTLDLYRAPIVRPEKV